MDAAASDAPDAELWRLYKDGCIEAQGRLYLRHAPWAKSIAVQIHGRIRAYPVDRQDFIQNATLGLLEAMSRFDPVMGVSFRHYAVARVRGAVFNGLRAILGDRPVAQEDSRMQERVRSLHGEADRDALEEVIDSVVGLGLSFLLDELAGGAEASGGMHYTQRHQVERRLEGALDRLPERLRLIIEAHYFHYTPFHEIASALSVTKGRVSQLHSAALKKLRESLHDLR